jgi:hypothetical protein
MTDTKPAQVNSRGVRSEEPTQNREGAAELYEARPKERVRPVSDRISIVPRLDVDAVLERSVRKVMPE